MKPGIEGMMRIPKNGLTVLFVSRTSAMLVVVAKTNNTTAAITQNFLLIL